MALPRLIEIAKGNISSYHDKFEGKPDKDKNKVNELKAGLSSSINMGIGTLYKTLKSHYKNRFEICAESNNMTLDEFSRLPLDKQEEFICAGMNDSNKVYGIRRVDFSNRYEEGLQLYYLALSMGTSAGRSEYGKCCVITKTLLDVALKYDSLRHYYNDKNEFDEKNCHNDLVPYENIELLLSDKFSDEISVADVDEIKRAIDKDIDPVEIMTTALINSNCIEVVVISNNDYKKIIQLDIKEARGESLDPKDKEDLQYFIVLQRELRRRRIELRILEEA